MRSLVIRLFILFGCFLLISQGALAYTLSPNGYLGFDLASEAWMSDCADGALFRGRITRLT